MSLPQARSVEEKRVWTHHIKRLILENHHAIIPQKVRRTGIPSQPGPPKLQNWPDAPPSVCQAGEHSALCGQRCVPGMRPRPRGRDF